MGVGRWCIDCGNFEFVLRVARVSIYQILLVNEQTCVFPDRVFGHTLRIKNSERSKSTGTFISPNSGELEGIGS